MYFNTLKIQFQIHVYNNPNIYELVLKRMDIQIIN